MKLELHKIKQIFTVATAMSSHAPTPQDHLHKENAVLGVSNTYDIASPQG